MVAHPDVVMAAAIGVPHPVKGEAIAVYAVTLGTPDDAGELARTLSDEVVASLGKAFRPIAVRLVDDLPRTRSAKIMRRVVRARALGEDTGDLTSLENPAAVETIDRLDL